MITQNRRIITTILFLLISFVSLALGDPEPPRPTPLPGTPIDGGVLAGFCVALFYGVRKMLKKN